eukprot:CAMPEP_0196155074 /NCGR_PEP_ID=MMETSP0910-20130528/40010_1 /TAXON_ID=49265 /ORGANISM="Thalassiosira rotula, Strain GSO102" /LENGTH=57 /DNA_ID=CAMNT_0041419219 /DNA_START=130 /DNA_END=300 /DNA_ORIENTATION=+
MILLLSRRVSDATDPSSRVLEKLGHAREHRFASSIMLSSVANNGGGHRCDDFIFAIS